MAETESAEQAFDRICTELNNEPTETIGYEVCGWQRWAWMRRKLLRTLVGLGGSEFTITTILG